MTDAKNKRIDDATGGGNPAAGETDAEKRLMRLLSCLAFIIEEADQLGYPNTAIEARRAGLQLCYEADTDQTLSMTFSGGMQGHA